jgi:hypothetical protein
MLGQLRDDSEVFASRVNNMPTDTLSPVTKQDTSASGDRVRAARRREHVPFR